MEQWTGRQQPLNINDKVKKRKVHSWHGLCLPLLQILFSAVKSCLPSYFQQNIFGMKTVEPKQHINVLLQSSIRFLHYYIVSVGVSIKI